MPVEERRVFGNLPNNELVTEEEALAWWPFRPLLRASDESSPPTRSWVAQSRAGGRSGRPPDFAALMLIYEADGVAAHNSDYGPIIAAGGYSVRAYYIPADVPISPMGRPVVVRGRPGSLWQVDPDDAGSAGWRTITWNEQLSEPGMVVWEVGTSPFAYNDNEALAVVDDLVEFG